MKDMDLRLYLVTDRSLTIGRPLTEIVEQAVEGGVTIVQLREKDCSSSEFYRLAIQLKKLLGRYHVPLIINDRLDIALACDADGLHIGQSDLPYPVVRRLLGPDKIIGISIENARQTLEANQWKDVDYVGISPVFGTPTKTDTAAALGLEGAKEIASLSAHPAVGIGGVNASNAAEVMKTGVDGICVVSAIMSADSPKKAAWQLRTSVDQFKNKTS